MALNGQRTVANVRERKRTQKLNQAYKRLQAIIPKEPSDKMSKINILKLALSYMKFLSKILEETDPCAGTSSTHAGSPQASSPTDATPEVPRLHPPVHQMAPVIHCQSPDTGSSPDSMHSGYWYHQPTVLSQSYDQSYDQPRSKRMKVSPSSMQESQYYQQPPPQQYMSKLPQTVDVYYHETGVPAEEPSYHKLELAQLFREYRSSNNFNMV